MCDEIVDNNDSPTEVSRTHEVNQAFLNLIKLVDNNVKDRSCRKLVFSALNQAKTLAIQGIIVDGIAERLGENLS